MYGFYDDYDDMGFMHNPNRVMAGYGNSKDSRNHYYYHNLNDTITLNRTVEEWRQSMLYPLFYNMDYDCINKEFIDYTSRLEAVRAANENIERMRRIAGDRALGRNRHNFRLQNEPGDPNPFKDRYDALNEFYSHTYHGMYSYTFTKVDFIQTEGYDPNWVCLYVY